MGDDIKLRCPKSPVVIAASCGSGSRGLAHDSWAAPAAGHLSKSKAASASPPLPLRPPFSSACLQLNDADCSVVWFVMAVSLPSFNLLAARAPPLPPAVLELLLLDRHPGSAGNLSLLKTKAESYCADLPH